MEPDDCNFEERCQVASNLTYVDSSPAARLPQTWPVIYGGFIEKQVGNPSAPDPPVRTG